MCYCHLFSLSGTEVQHSRHGPFPNLNRPDSSTKPISTNWLHLQPWYPHTPVRRSNYTKPRISANFSHTSGDRYVDCYHIGLVYSNRTTSEQQ